MLRVQVQSTTTTTVKNNTTEYTDISFNSFKFRSKSCLIENLKLVTLVA